MAESDLNAALDALEGGLILFDAAARVLWWNIWFASASGISLEVGQGRSVDEIFPGPEESRLQWAVADALELGISRTLSHALNPGLLPLRRRDGRSLIHNMLVKPVERAGTRLALVQVIDASAAHDRERILRDRLNARFSAVVDGAFDAILTTDGQGHIQWLNAAAVRQFGYTTDEAEGQEITLLLPHQPGLGLGLIERPIESVGRRKDGTFLPVEVSVAPWTSDGRRQLTVILRDLSERKRAEDALRAAAAVSSGTSDNILLEELARELATGLGVEHAHIAVFADAAGQRLRSLAAWSAGGVLEPFEVPVGDIPCAVTLAEGSCVVPRDAQARFPKGSVLAEYGFQSYVGVRFHDAQGKPVGVVCAMDRLPLANPDLAHRLVAAFAARVGGELARQRAEADLRSLNADLEQRVSDRTQALAQAAADLVAEMKQREDAQAALAQSQKLEALGQLVGGVAHDFNNLLAAITGSYALIGRRIQDPEILTILEHGRKAADRATELIRHLLAFARREELKPKVVEPARLLADVADLLFHAAGAQVSCTIDTDPEAWPVLVDTHRLEVALLNLVVNARDAMPDGGSLVIRARRLSRRETRPSQLPEGDYSVISVSDTGSGMSPEVLARAVEPFFTTKVIGKGTGLGLAMVHGFVEQSGGALTIESRMGEGTTISLVLPRADAAVAVEDRASALVRVPAQQRTGVVLVVDDDDQVRPVTAAFLRDLGYDVLEAASGDAAISIVQATSRLDIVVTDVVMPDMDGPTLATRLRATRPDLPLVFVTGHADPGMLDGETVIAKPFSPNELALGLLQHDPNWLRSEEDLNHHHEAGPPS
ncbi:PAS domain S-box protein [Rubellimicrobium rubrum]|uniref:histidine kinase n=1 Tax=Rubellimicrobium rubrum TaxID=2585369 RepID=A0A5C4MP81_9RHOB|nr:PAS domain S-box protein [Rubellimicrobium rubrum]TNC46223.1 PAS domain S-box protein [Rubellimicrobium rubrum]